jgi:hypothetical protein
MTIATVDITSLFHKVTVINADAEGIDQAESYDASA